MKGESEMTTNDGIFKATSHLDNVTDLVDTFFKDNEVEMDEEVFEDFCNVLAEATKPMAGKVIRELKDEIARNYRNSDRPGLINSRVKYNALKELIGEVRQFDNKMHDSANAGYVDAKWLVGIDRLVKIDPLNPRGRKASVKPDPADLI